jgi:hypothetical protein
VVHHRLELSITPPCGHRDLTASAMRRRHAGRVANRTVADLVSVMIPLSVLDLSPVTTASTGATALKNSLDLARLADRLGYIGCHDGLPGTAGFRAALA